MDFSHTDESLPIMGMSGSTYNARSNEITRAYYMQLLAVNPDSVYKIDHCLKDGRYLYTSYHLSGVYI